MKNRRKSSIKIVTTVALFIVTALAVAVGIVTVFALTQHSVDSSIFIRYTATDIDGSVKATYQLIGKESKDNGEVVDMGTINFSVHDGKSDHEISPTEDLKLTKATPHIEFTYIFTNNGSRDFTATVSLKDVIENNNISFNYAYQNYDYLSESFSILVQGVETGKNVVTYKIKMGVESFAKNAGFKGSLFWDLKTPEIEDEATQISVNSLNFTDKSDGTYSATYTGGEIKDNTLVIPNEINGVKITSVGNVRNLPYGSKVVLSEGITTIENSAFANTHMTEIELPDSLENIGDSAFYVAKLKSIYIPKTVTEIGIGAFSYCVALETIEVEEGSVFRVENNCLIKGTTLLAGCKTTTAIPSSVTTIEQDAFRGIYITSLHIPKTVTNIVSNPFSTNYHLESITAEEGGKYSAVGNCLLEGTKLITGCKNSVIPDGVTEIGNHAFAAMDITSVQLPETLTIIGAYAFQSCSSLTEIILPSNLKSIAQGAFHACSSIQTLTIPASVELIDSIVFASMTNLKTVYIEIENVNSYMHNTTFQNDTATIYCKLTSKPERWNDGWYGNCTVVWGY